MISGAMPRRAERALPALLLAWALAAGAAEPWTLERLLRGFALTREARASFVEKKSVRVLDRPLVSSGELRFEAPDRLEKRTLRPRPELLRLEGDTLTLERGDRRLRLDLRSNPEAAALVESIRGTLAGDRASLESIYSLALEGGANAWRLVLTPKEEALRQLVARVTIEGSQARVERVEIEQADGDRSLMQIRPEKR
jgi:hypothetical protein